MSDHPTNQTSADWRPDPNDIECGLIETCDYRGEAAGKIATLRGCGFADALQVVYVWEQMQ